MTSVDGWTLGYAIVAVAAFVWRVPHERLPALLAIHALLVVLVLMMPRARRAGPVGRFLGDWYPLLIVTALYTEVGLVNLADGRAYDRMVLGWEQALFGFQPAREWIRSNPSTGLSWILYLGYLAYYPIIAAAPLALWATGQREAMRQALTTIMATFYVCYTIFLVFPVVGPRHVFAAADNVATQTMIAQFTARFIDHVAAWGAAFPSSHVAVSVAATAAALRQWRALGALLVVPTALLALGSVYGQFHYAVDVLAGLGVGLAVAAGIWLTSRRPSEAASEARGSTLDEPATPNQSSESAERAIPEGSGDSEARLR
jgi:membrane-associated phospholipid phosphatase